jgi:hypothetical protein
MSAEDNIAVYLFEYWPREVEGLKKPDSESYHTGTRPDVRKKWRELNEDKDRTHNVTMRWVEWA